MAGNSVGLGGRGCRRRSVLRGVGAAGIGGLAGCIRSTDEIKAEGDAEELIQAGFAETGVEPPFRTTIAITENDEREQFAQLFKATLDETGFFDVSIDSREFRSHVDLMRNAASNDVNALFVASWTGGWDPDSYVNMLFHSDNHTPDGFNVGHYANEAVDDGIDAGLVETDPDERISVYRGLQETLVADSPISFVRFSESTHVWDADTVSGWQTYPLEPGAYYAVYAPWAGTYTELDEGSEFVGDLGSDIATTDPVSMTDTVSSHATALVYEELVAVDFDGESQPLLATDWERLDGTTVRVHLREGVQFHNGEELTAAHVAGSFDRYEGTIRETDVYDWYERSEIVDEHTIDIECWREYGPLETALFNVPIVPMAAIDGEYDLESEPVGTGPYRFGDYDSGSHWRLERFDDHWFEGDDTVPATAPVETVTLEIITETASRQAALEAGNIDFSYGLPSANVSEFENDDAYGVGRHIGGGFDMVIYPCYRAPFTSAKVRRGCNMLLPRTETLETVYDGFGQLAYTPISPLLEAYSDEAFQETIADEYVRPN
ncbi:ABC transporter substrate-binding protein [Natrinema ejinorense]|uniref:Solute-binding protein family 5 domain-containing protein n=1 Tax=Natrinema ejinorense TaxID=373386 RepID=A0A2A5QRU2_9EURY|nr:ABC transporter substrate-binding protein [Natrinema ejinorense]PCR89524.1 hypothetical protein CP557_02640 [Natrinema ejinorense]